MGFPLGDGHPVLIDYATTTIAGSKVTAFRDKNEPLPPNSVVDKDGNPTTDANACLDGGSHLPFGAHKGYALMLAVEFFGRILSGAGLCRRRRGRPHFSSLWRGDDGRESGPISTPDGLRDGGRGFSKSYQSSAAGPWL